MAYEKPTLLNKTDESVRLSWAPVSVHNLPADSRRVSYVVESRELPNSVWTKVAYNVPTSSYLVRHLRPDKEYEFRVRAQNQHGVSEPSRTATMEKRVGQLLPLEISVIHILSALGDPCTHVFSALRKHVPHLLSAHELVSYCPWIY